jgi:hypothetical protein
MWFTYIHGGAKDVFSTGPPRDYISQKPVAEREREWSNGAVSEEEKIVAITKIFSNLMKQNNH